MATGLGIVRSPSTRYPEDIRGESQETEILDVNASRILSPLDDYAPLIDEAKSKTEDPICIEIASECDRLRVLIDQASRLSKKPGEVSAIIVRRLSALKLLGQRLDEVEGKEQIRVELSTISKMMTIVKEIMRETGVSQETREIVFQKLLSRVSSLREEGGF